MSVKKIWEFFLDMLFPIECARCGEEGKWLCDYCFSKIKFNETQICPLCGSEIKLGFSCVCTIDQKKIKTLKQENKNQGSVDIYITFVNLKENLFVRNLIHRLKYNFVEDISKDLAKIGIAFFKKNHSSLELFMGDSLENIFIAGELENRDIIVTPVPLHKKRLLWRGFNQSEIIMEEMRRLGKGIKKQELGIRNGEPSFAEAAEGKEIKKLEIEKLRNRKDGVLFRRKNTKFQGKAKMTEEHRRNNMNDAFEIHTPAPSQEGKILEGKTVILFDDVITTGVTMEECARVLKENGVKKVIAMAVGKG